MKLKFRDKIEIRWIDSYGDCGVGWDWKNAVESNLDFKKKFMYIKSVGQFIAEDKDVIIISHSINETSESMLSPMYIPKVAILEIKKL